MLFRKSTFTFFQQKNITKMFKERLGWVGTFVIEMIAGPKFWTIPFFFKKNEKKSVNFYLSNH